MTWPSSWVARGPLDGLGEMEIQGIIGMSEVAETSKRCATSPTYSGENARLGTVIDESGTGMLAHLDVPGQHRTPNPIDEFAAALEQGSEGARQCSRHLSNEGCSDETDPLKDCVSLYVIIAGRQVRLHATYGQPSGKSLKLIAPVQFEHATVVAVIRTDNEGSFRLFHVIPSANSKFANERGGYIEVTAEFNGDLLSVNKSNARALAISRHCSETGKQTGYTLKIRW